MLNLQGFQYYALLVTASLTDSLGQSGRKASLNIKPSKGSGDGENVGLANVFDLFLHNTPADNALSYVLGVHKTDAS